MNISTPYFVVSFNTESKTRLDIENKAYTSIMISKSDVEQTLSDSLHYLNSFWPSSARHYVFWEDINGTTTGNFCFNWTEMKLVFAFYGNEYQNGKMNTHQNYEDYSAI